MTLSVHIQFHADADAKACLLGSLEPGVQVTWGDKPPDAAAYSVLLSGRPSPELLAASPRLSALVIPWAGLPGATADLMAKIPHVAVHNLHHNAPATAEMALALLLAAAKSIVAADNNLRLGDWTMRGEMSAAVQLEGATALVLGYGAIGRRVARGCRGLGMKVIAVARHSAMPEGDDELHLVDALPEVLPRADALLVCLPATPHTEGLLGPNQLALLPQHCVLVNVARGQIVHEQALYDALRAKRIRAAGLDVWWKYPDSDPAQCAPSRFPFHELPNVVMSPHRGGHVQQTESLRMKALAELLNAAAQGRPMPHKVDLGKGY